MIIILDQQDTVITATELCEACHNMCEPGIFLSITHFCLSDELYFFCNDIAVGKTGSWISFLCLWANLISPPPRKMYWQVLIASSTWEHEGHKKSHCRIRPKVHLNQYFVLHSGQPDNTHKQEMRTHLSLLVSLQTENRRHIDLQTGNDIQREPSYVFI